MAEEQLELSVEYKKGFNDAYRLSESMPQIFKGLEGIKAEKNDYNHGFDDGRSEYERKHMRDKLREHHKGKEQSKGRSRGK